VSVAHPWRRGVVLAAATLLLGGLLAGCGSSGATTLILYSGQHEATTQALVNAFTQATGIKVEVRYADEDVLAAAIVTEGRHAPADVIYTENSPALEYLQQQGLLAPVDASTLAKTPSQYNSPQGDWVGVSARVSVIIYNPSLISAAQLPTSVMELADPRYAGELAFSATETDFQPIITAVDRVYGTAKTLAWLAGIKRNAGGNLYPDNETIADEVNRGQVAFGVVNQYYWYRMRDEVGAANMHSLITYFAPENPGYVIDVSGAAVLRSAAHPTAAQAFLAFLVSKTGQEKINDSASFEYPIASSVTTDQGETPFASLRPFPITVGELSNGRLAISLLQRAGFI
jgi:iron(III) transport system substrate-binding protein